MLCDDDNAWTAIDPVQLGGWAYQWCPFRNVVCGLQTNILPFQDAGVDDLGVVAVNLKCCEYGNIHLPVLMGEVVFLFVCRGFDSGLTEFIKIAVIQIRYECNNKVNQSSIVMRSLRGV